MCKKESTKKCTFVTCIVQNETCVNVLLENELMCDNKYRRKKFWITDFELREERKKIKYACFLKNDTVRHCKNSKKKYTLHEIEELLENHRVLLVLAFASKVCKIVLFLFLKG